MDNKVKGPAYTSLKNIVYQAIADLGESEAMFEKFLGYAIWQHRKLNRHGFLGFKTKEVTPTAYKSVLLPDDCIDWISISVLKGVHLWHYVRSNNMLNKFKELQAGGDLESALQYDKAAETYAISGYLNKEGYDVGQLFGMKASYNEEGYYSYDQDEGVIQLHSLNTPTGRLFLRYISDCTNQKSETFVHQNHEDVIKTWILKEASKNSNNQLIFRKYSIYRDEYERAEREMLALDFDLSIEDIEEVFWDSYSLSPTY